MRTLALIVALAGAVTTSQLLQAQSGPAQPTTGKGTAWDAKNSATDPSANNPANETVSITNGATSFTGTVAIPVGTGRHGAVLIVVNGDSQSAGAAKEMAKAFAMKGMVALTYTTPVGTAEDAVAAINSLKLRGDVQPDNVGIVGVGMSTTAVMTVAKAADLRYVVSVIPTTRAAGAGDPMNFGKLSQRILLVQGMTDAFSDKTEKYQRSVQQKAHNITLWPTSDDDITTLGGHGSTLLDRITVWASERSA
jgi:dienelactone hydrolase